MRLYENIASQFIEAEFELACAGGCTGIDLAEISRGLHARGK
jgi:hypothetical protein